jgi:hypothetical protein
MQILTRVTHDTKRVNDTRLDGPIFLGSTDLKAQADKKACKSKGWEFPSRDEGPKGPFSFALFVLLENTVDTAFLQ